VNFGKKAANLVAFFVETLMVGLHHCNVQIAITTAKFNSLKVRLKWVLMYITSPVLLKFQFQTGTIKSRNRLLRLGERSNISILPKVRLKG